MRQRSVDEYAVIEARIECAIAQFDAGGSDIERVVAGILEHDGVSKAWLKQTRILASRDSRKANQLGSLLAEARFLNCPAGKPNAQLASLLERLAPAESVPPK